MISVLEGGFVGTRERTDQVGLERSAAMSMGALGDEVSELYVRVEGIVYFRALRVRWSVAWQLLHM